MSAPLPPKLLLLALEVEIEFEPPNPEVDEGLSKELMLDVAFALLDVDDESPDVGLLVDGRLLDEEPLNEFTPENWLFGS